MNDEMVADMKRILGKRFIAAYQTERIVAARLDAERLLLTIAPVQAEITHMDDIGHILRINGPIGACMGAGLAADAAHVVSDQQFVFIRLLLQRLNRACRHTMRILASAADQKIGGKLGNGNDTIVGRMIEIAALYLTLLALPGSANIQIDE
jgi:hypothetical protein